MFGPNNAWQCAANVRKTRRDASFLLVSTPIEDPPTCGDQFTVGPHPESKSFEGPKNEISNEDILYSDHTTKVARQTVFYLV